MIPWWQRIREERERDGGGEGEENDGIISIGTISHM